MASCFLRNSLLLIGIVLLMQSCTAQDKKNEPEGKMQSLTAEDSAIQKYFDQSLEELEVVYKKQDNFNYARPQTYFPFNDQGHPMLADGIVYELASSEGKVAITFSLAWIKKSLDWLSKHKKRYPNSSFAHDFNSDYLRHLDQVMDTTTENVKFFSKEQSLQLWNADRAAIGESSIYSFNAPKYKDKFDLYRLLIIHKENIGNVELYYWYTADTKQEMEKAFEATKTMVRFKDSL